MKKLNPAQRCRVNRWKKGTLLKAIHSGPPYAAIIFFRITAIGKREVLGEAISKYDELTSDESTSDEILIPFNNPLYSVWRKTSIRHLRVWQMGY